MKITKSKLAQIVQEELQAVTAEGYKAYKRDELGDENERIYPQRTLSRHAKDMAKNKKDGYSAQAAVTAIPDNEEVDKAYHNSLNKKPKRGLEEAGKDMDTLEAHMLGRKHALEVSQGEREDSDIMMMGNAAYRAGFEDATEEMAIEAGESDSWDDEGRFDNDDMYENKITKSKLAQIIKEELAAVDIEEGMMDKIGTKFRSMTGKSTPQDKYKHYIAKANKMILDLATFMFRKMDLDGAPDTTEELLKNPYDHGGRLSAIKKALKRSKLMRNDTIKKAVESLDNLIHDKNTDVALQYFAGGDDLEKFRGHPFMAAVRWIDSYDVDDVASALSRTWSNKRSGDDDRKAAIRQRNIDSERETTRRDRKQLNQRVAAKKYQKQVADERERELSRRGNRDNLSADTTMGAFGESLERTKITKSQLAQIIKEELKATLSEDGSGYSWGARGAPKSEPTIDEIAQDSGVQEMIYSEIENNLGDGPLPLDGILTLTKPEYESPYEDLADQWEDILEAALQEMSEEPNATIEKSHDTMTGEPYYSPIGFLS